MKKSKADIEFEKLLRELNKKKKQHRFFGSRRSMNLRVNNSFGSGNFHYQSFVQAMARKSFSRSSPKMSNQIVVKTNYCFSGHSKSRSGKRLSGKEVIAKAQANLNYISRDGANKDLENGSSNLYRLDGSLMNTDEYRGYKEELKEQELSGFRRIMISVKDEVTRDEMRQIVVGAINEFSRETHKEFDGVFAVHTNTDHTHAHVLMTSESYNALRWSASDLQLFKEIVHDREQQLVADRILQTDRVIDNEVHRDGNRTIEIERNIQHDNARIH